MLRKKSETNFSVFLLFLAIINSNNADVVSVTLWNTVNQRQIFQIFSNKNHIYSVRPMTPLTP